MLFFPKRGGAFTLASLFADAQDGALYKAYEISTLFQDSLGVTPVTAANDPIGLAVDQSGNDNDALQATSSRRLTYQITPTRMALDKVDDRLILDVPVGGWTGSMVLATDVGTATYGVTIPAGNHDIGGKGGTHFPGAAFIGWLFRDGVLSAEEAANAEQVFVDNGAVASYGAVSSFRKFWFQYNRITTFPLIDASSSSSFESAWQNCTSITSPFPSIDTSSGTDFRFAWSNCNTMTSFPSLDVSAGTAFEKAWDACTSMTSFPANMFDSVTVGAFQNTFRNGALSETSIDGILVSLVASGIDSGTRDFLQSGGNAPSVGTGQPAIDTLRTRGWTVVTTGGY